jgi:hypothetical protein
LVGWLALAEDFMGIKSFVKMDEQLNGDSVDFLVFRQDLNLGFNRSGSRQDFRR